MTAFSQPCLRRHIGEPRVKREAGRLPARRSLNAAGRHSPGRAGSCCRHAGSASSPSAAARVINRSTRGVHSSACTSQYTADPGMRHRNEKQRRESFPAAVFAVVVMPLGLRIYLQAQLRLPPALVAVGSALRAEDAARRTLV